MITKDIFTERLKAILTVRKVLRTNEVISVLNQFWQFYKDKLDIHIQNECYNIVVYVLRMYKTIIENSRGRYTYVHSKVLLEGLNNG